MTPVINTQTSWYISSINISSSSYAIDSVFMVDYVDIMPATTGMTEPVLLSAFCFHHKLILGALINLIGRFSVLRQRYRQQLFVECGHT